VVCVTLATDLFLLLVGAGALWYGAERFVEGAVGLARRVNVPELVVGVVIVGIGTSMPEVVASSAAALGGRTDIAIGNAVGSCSFNAFGVVGLVAVLAPGSVTSAATVTTLWLVGLTALVTALLFTGRKLTRVEGMVATAVNLVRWTLDIL